MPVTLYDPKSGNPIIYHDNEYEKARADLLSGTVTTRKGQEFNIIAPPTPVSEKAQYHRSGDASSKTGTVAGADLPKYLEQGWGLETPKQAKLNNYLQENSGLAGSFKVGGAKLASEIAFGIPELVYEKMAPDDVAEWEALKEEHQIASAVGSVAGIGASLYYGGPLFKGAASAGRGVEGLITGARTGKNVLETAGALAKAPGLTRRMAGTVLGGATEGAVISAPHAITEAILGDPEEAAEHLLMGAGLGAGLGGITQGVKELTKLSAKAIDYSMKTIAGDKLENAAAKALINGNEKDAIKTLQELKYLDKDKGLESVDTFLRNKNLVIGPNEKYIDYLNRINMEREQIGSNIGRFFKDVEAAENKSSTAIDGNDLIDDLEKAMSHIKTDPFMKSESDKLIEIINNLKEDIISKNDDLGRSLSTNYLWNLKKNLQTKIYNESKTVAFNPTPINKLLESFRVKLDDAIVENISALNSSKKSMEILVKSNPEYQQLLDVFDKVPPVEELQRLNKEFNLLSGIKKVTDKSALNEQAAELKGHNILSSLTAGFGGAGLALGHPAAAIGGLAASYGMNKLSTFLKEHEKRFAANLVANTDRPGLVTSLLSNKLFGEKFDNDFAKALLSITSKTSRASKAVYIKPQDIFNLLTGEKEKDQAKAFRNARDLVTFISQNPSKAQEIIKPFADHLADGAPGVSAAYQAKLLAQFDLINRTMPKESDPKLFSGGVEKTSVSSKEQKKWANIIKVIIDPKSVQDAIRTNTLTPEMVTAIQAAYPKTYARMMTKITEKGMTPDAKLNNSYRSTVALFMRAPLSESQKNVINYQAMYEPINKPATSAGGQTGKQYKLKNLPGSTQSDIGRLTTTGNKNK